MRPLAALTGGTGFLGRHVAAALEGAGWRLRLLVRDPASISTEEAQTVRGSLSDTGALDALVDGADAVIHLAGLVRARSRAEFMAVNREGTAALAVARRARAPGSRLVVVSSMAAREPGLSDYAASKAAGEAALPPGEAVVLRPCAVYGPGDRATLSVFRLARWPVHPMPNGPAARVSLVHAADVAAAVVSALRPDVSGGTWELTDERVEGYGWAEIVAAASRACGRTARPFHVPAAALLLAGMAGDLGARLGATPMITRGKVREILHPSWGSAPERQPPTELWRPSRGLHEGFVETVEWYRREGWLPAPRRDHTGGGGH